MGGLIALRNKNQTLMISKYDEKAFKGGQDLDELTNEFFCLYYTEQLYHTFAALEL